MAFLCNNLAVYCRLKPLVKLAALLMIILWNIAWRSDKSWLEDALAIGIAVGAKAPGFELPDQAQRMRNMASLMGRRGLVLVFVRSADW